MYFILTSGKLIVNKTELQTLVGPTVTRLVQDPLAVLRLDNRLFMNPPLTKFPRRKMTYQVQW